MIPSPMLAIGCGVSTETMVEGEGLGLGGGGGQGSTEFWQLTGEEATGSAGSRLGNDTPSPKLKHIYIYTRIYIHIYNRKKQL